MQKTAAMFVSQTNPVGVELLSYLNSFVPNPLFTTVANGLNARQTRKECQAREKLQPLVSAGKCVTGNELWVGGWSGGDSEPLIS